MTSDIIGDEMMKKIKKFFINVLMYVGVVIFVFLEFAPFIIFSLALAFMFIMLCIVGNGYTLNS